MIRMQHVARHSLSDEHFTFCVWYQTKQKIWLNAEKFQRARAGTDVKKVENHKHSTYAAGELPETKNVIEIEHITNLDFQPSRLIVLCVYAYHMHMQ